MEKPSSASSKEGAWADMLIVSGDPTKDIDVLNDYEHHQER
jgi:imidazolonepropionase-like amidohydrolase